jgi:hypothetical protein
MGVKTPKMIKKLPEKLAIRKKYYICSILVSAPKWRAERAQGEEKHYLISGRQTLHLAAFFLTLVQ